MKIANRLVAFVLAAFAASASIAADTDAISAYLADLSPGAVSASEMLGLSPSAVSTLRAPKDFVLAIEGLGSSASKDGFGLSFTPARTRFAPVSIGDYREKGLSRLWAGTTISYAQNTNTLGDIGYKQEAYALHISYYFDPKEDPAVAAHLGFDDCLAARKLADDEVGRFNKIADELRRSGTDPEQIDKLAKIRAAKDVGFGKAATTAVNACVDHAVGLAKAKWNANQGALTLGEGWIKGPESGASRLSIGRSVSLAATFGPNPDSLINVTVRRTNKALDLTTIATTPDFKSSTLLGARYTFRASAAQDLYALAEISNAKGSSAGISNNVFKSALGIDKRLFEGAWVELRVGRNHTSDGKTEQTSALMNVKLSPSSTLPH